MRFDIAQIAPQIADLVGSVDPDADRERHQRLRLAWEELDANEVNRRFRDARTTFLIPGPHPDFRERRELPPPLPEVTVVATDGSYILPSRHSPARFFVINTGHVRLAYGEEPGAEIWSDPSLYFREEDLVVPNDVNRQPINGSTIGPRRAAEELRALADDVENLPWPCVGLQDGTLILWSLESQSDSVRDWVLPDFLDSMRRIRDSGAALASYISAPGSAELLNTLRIAVCDYPDRGLAVNCDDCRRRIPDGHTPACDALPPVTDNTLLRQMNALQTGDRSGVFESRSHIIERYTDGGAEPSLGVWYFYLHVGMEIGRVEIPGWVANDPTLLDLVHRVAYDQAQLGRGYPIALQEAHEAAVLSTSDRRLIEDTIERELARAGITLQHSGKDGSKRVRVV